MPVYKLYYFDGRALAEPIRQIFAYAGEPYEDIRVPMEQWPEYKAKMAFGTMPVLEEDGKQIPQSAAIGRYLAKKHGLAGKNAFEQAWVDALVDQFKDYFFEFRKYFATFAGFIQGDVELAKKEHGDPAVEKFYPIIEKRLSASKSGFLVGDDVTWVDFLLSEHVATIQEQLPGIVNNYPKIIAEGPSIVINQSEDVLKEMDPWCVNTFSKNGLLEKIRASTISLPDAEQQVLSFLRQHVEKGICPLAGNSVHVDRTFLAKYMKQVDEYLHYRIIDVSTVKELAFRWYPHAPTPPKKGAHRALDDIKESIKELAFYRKHLFK